MTSRTFTPKEYDLERNFLNIISNVNFVAKMTVIITNTDCIPWENIGRETYDLSYVEFLEEHFKKTYKAEKERE